MANNFFIELLLISETALSKREVISANGPVLLRAPSCPSWLGKISITTKDTKSHQGKPRITDTAGATFLRTELSRARAPDRKSRPPRVQLPCRSRRAARRHTCANPDTT